MASTCPTCGDRFDTAAFCPADGARLVVEADPDERIGEVIGDRYRLLRKVGEGGVGQVFEAEHIYIHKRVAIKLLRPQAALNPDAVQRLHREARATSAIGHPNIVHIEDYGTMPDNSVFLAMEWLDGESIEALVQEGPVDVSLALQIVTETCAGLAAAHEAGVIHRDLKPANILWVRGKNGQHIKIVDFGIAKLTSGDSNLTRTGTFMGTPYYMAPEQAVSTDVDHRADIYSLGVILYELVTGWLPFTAETSLGVLHQHATVRPMPPRQRAPQRQISPGLEAIILRCLEKDPDRRFATAEDLHAALAAESSSLLINTLPAAESVPDAAIDDGFDDDLRPAKNRWPAYLAIIVVVALIAVGVLFALRGGGDAEREQSAATAVDARAANPVGKPVDGGSMPQSPSAAGAPPPGDAAAPPVAAWTFRGKTAKFSYTARVTPRPIQMGKPARIELRFAKPSPRFARALAAGVMAHVTFVYFRTHLAVGKVEQPVGPDGSLSLRPTFQRRGKHHVKLVLTSAGAPLGKATFDICVGADPDAPERALRGVCPRMNVKRKTHHH